MTETEILTHLEELLSRLRIELRWEEGDFTGGGLQVRRQSGVRGQSQPSRLGKRSRSCPVPWLS